MRVEKSRIKVVLLIACRYKLSRPKKDRKASTGFIHKTGCDAYQELLGCLKNPLGLLVIFTCLFLSFREMMLFIGT